MKPTFALYMTVLQKQFRNYCQTELQKHGISHGQLFFILYIGKHPQCSPKEVSTQLHFDTGHTTRTLSKLEQAQLITQDVNPEDKRARLLSLTPQGKEIFQLSHQFFSQWDQETLQCLSTEEVETLLILLDKIMKNTQERKNF